VFFILRLRNWKYKLINNTFKVLKISMQINNTKPNFSIHSNNKGLSLEKPVVMGILNLTPDSFYDGGKYKNEQAIEDKLAYMIDSGASIIDIGAASAKPGSNLVDTKIEQKRLAPILSLIKNYPSTFFSIDTYNSETVKFACDFGIDIINDISSGNIDSKMIETVAALGKPYITMHMQGEPENMQVSPSYVHVTKEVLQFFEHKIEALKKAGIHEIILDVGFGFGKTIAHNYQLLKELDLFESIGYPILVGLSRKGMIYNVLETTPEFALNGTTALNMVALQNGAKILRVHDVKEAMECVKLFQAYNN
jgi:dihydropteroate synthase